jgi:hypothetical protein
LNTDAASSVSSSVSLLTFTGEKENSDRSQGGNIFAPGAQIAAINRRQSLV